MKPRDVVLLAGVAAVAVWYLKKQAIAAGAAVLNLPSQVGEGIANALYDWLNPSSGIEETFIIFTLPTGARHSISSRLINSAGQFVYNGVPYVMKRDAGGQNIAVPA